MVRRSAFFAAALLLAAACDKGESSEVKVTGPDDTGKALGGTEAPTTIDAAPPATVLSAKPGEPTAPPGWKPYKNAGYSITAPPAPPKNTDFGDTAELQGLAIVGQEFRFADCFGQVMRLHYEGTEEFDIEKGLDGGIDKMLKNIGVAKTKSSSEPDDGRISRQYRVDGSWKGTDRKSIV